MRYNYCVLARDILLVTSRLSPDVATSGLFFWTLKLSLNGYHIHTGMGTIWTDRCQKIIETSDKPSQRAYAQSVLTQIRRCPLLYPTVAQETRLRQMLKHCDKLELSDVEKDALEFLGR